MLSRRYRRKREPSNKEAGWNRPIWTPVSEIEGFLFEREQNEIPGTRKEETFRDREAGCKVLDEGQHVL